ncbi:hypothetical protein [Plantibacter sp. RU18]|uniref:hypothetical protein n=1 Tax=Plantibacter sp. RU18 TaxID=3158143 RepID=UPI003D36610F
MARISYGASMMRRGTVKGDFMKLTNHTRQLVKTSKKCGIALVAAALIGFSAPTAAVASEPSGSPLPTSPETELVVSGGQGLSVQQEAELSAVFVGVSDNSTVFDIEAAQAAGASPESIADFATIVGGAGWTVENGATTVEASDLAVEIAAEVRACTGATGYTGFHGAFWQWGLDSCLTDSLIAAVASGAGSGVAIGGVLAAAGLAPAAALSAAIGALTGMSAGFLKVCQTASYGAHAIYLNAYVTGNVGCWGQ